MAAEPGDRESPAEIVRVDRANEVSGEPLFTAADLRAARWDRSDHEGATAQAKAAEAQGRA
jgi:hypothetical protein